MAVNAALVGRSYPAGEPYEVSRAKIREFADAIGDTNPAYRDRAAAAALGHPDVVAPPTFAIILSFEAGRVVHGEQGFTYDRPIRAGDVLVATPTIRAVRSAGRNEILTVDCTIATSVGEPVCTATNTLVVRGTPAGAKREHDRESRWRYDVLMPERRGCPPVPVRRIRVTDGVRELTDLLPGYLVRLARRVRAADQGGIDRHGRGRLAGLAMGRVGAAVAAELAQLHAVRVVTPVLAGDVVAVLALLTGHCDLGSYVGGGHGTSASFRVAGRYSQTSRPGWIAAGRGSGGRI